MDMTFSSAYNDEGLCSEGKNDILHNISESEPVNEVAALFVSIKGSAIRHLACGRSEQINLHCNYSIVLRNIIQNKD